MNTCVDPLSSMAQRTGLVLLILVVVQSIFGIAIKLAAKTKIQDPDRVPSIKKHPLQNLFHVLMGVRQCP